MNERIKELAEQAGFSFRVDNVTDDEMVRIYKNADKVEKFAELIIRECASVIFKEIGPKSALTVLENFGVEE